MSPDITGAAPRTRASSPGSRRPTPGAARGRRPLRSGVPTVGARSSRWTGLRASNKAHPEEGLPMALDLRPEGGIAVAVAKLVRIFRQVEEERPLLVAIQQQLVAPGTRHVGPPARIFREDELRARGRWRDPDRAATGARPVLRPGGGWAPDPRCSPASRRARRRGGSRGTSPATAPWRGDRRAGFPSGAGGDSQGSRHGRWYRRPECSRTAPSGAARPASARHDGRSA